MEVSEFLAKLAPGQNGIIYQGPGNWRKVSCPGVVGEAVVMLIHKGTGEGEITLGEAAAFKTRSDNGLLRVEGTLTGSGNDEMGEQVKFTPDTSAQIINRRQAFRIESDIHTKMVGTASATADTGEQYGYEWECVLRDLSVGGANAVLSTPGPTPRSLATLTFKLPTEATPLVVECEIIEVVAGANPPPMDTMVRLMFKGLNSSAENQLGKYINWVQLEERRRGLDL